MVGSAALGSIVTEISPEKNTELSGLYTANGIFCTQCEAEGFRRITYFIDRPDNLAVYTTRIEADKAKYPVLLSNGNPIAKGDLPGGRFSVFICYEAIIPQLARKLVANGAGVLVKTRSGYLPRT